MFFELEDIRRRHTLYSDIFNVGVWVEAPDNTLRWNVTRGAIAGISGHLLGEYFHNIFINWKLLAKQYVAPQGALGHIKFLLATQATENYKKSLRTRAQYAVTIGAIDWGSRVAAYRWINNGWQKNYGGFEHGFVRKIPGSIFIAALTAPIGVPFELARIAYYADKTFPKELQRGYTSYFNALLRIPVEEGPYYLFKNSFPIYSRNFIQTLTLFYSFDWMKDKLSLFTRLSEIPYIYIKAINCFLATTMAICFSYPFGNTSKEMVDLWPKKSANAPHPFLNNYRDAASHIWYTNFLNNYYPGMLRNYASRSFLSLYATLWTADSFGIFSYWKIDMFSGQGTNSWEDSFS